MAKKPSALARFLMTAKNLGDFNKQQQADGQPVTPSTGFMQTAIQTQKAEEKVPQAVETKTQEVVKQTGKPEVLEGSSGIKYDKTAYNTTTKQVQDSTKKALDATPVPTTPVTLDTIQQTQNDIATKNQATADEILQGLNITSSNAINKMANVRLAFATKGLDEAKKTWQQEFGSDMPAEVEGLFNKDFKGTDILKETVLKGPNLNTFGQFNTLNDPEALIRQQLAQTAGAEPTSNLAAMNLTSSLYGVDPRTAALRSQAENEQLRNALAVAKDLGRRGVETENLRQQSVEDYLTAQQEGKKNIDTFLKGIKEKTAGEEKALTEDLTKEINDLTKASTAAKGMTARANQEQASKIENQLVTGVDNALSKELKNANLDQFKTEDPDFEKNIASDLDNLARLTKNIEDMRKYLTKSAYDNMITKIQETKDRLQKRAESVRQYWASKKKFEEGEKARLSNPLTVTDKDLRKILSGTPSPTVSKPSERRKLRDRD